MRRVAVICVLALLTGVAGAAPSFQGFETDIGDWVFNDGGAVSGRVASGGGVLHVPSASGLYHAELANVQDDYQPGYGNAGYSYFGGMDPVYQGAFYQAIDVYINPTWSGPSWAGFWIDMSPADIDGSSLYGAEGNFRLTADGSSVAVQAINSSTLANITTPGWYSFEMVWSKGASPTDLINMDLNLYDSTHMLLGTESFLAVFTPPPGDHPGESQYLGNNSYVWLAVWQNGFANDVIAIDNVRTGLVPSAIPAPGALLLGSLGASFVGWLRRRRTL